MNAAASSYFVGVEISPSEMSSIKNFLVALCRREDIETPRLLNMLLEDLSPEVLGCFGDLLTAADSVGAMLVYAEQLRRKCSVPRWCAGVDEEGYISIEITPHRNLFEDSAAIFQGVGVL